MYSWIYGPRWDQDYAISGKILGQGICQFAKFTFKANCVGSNSMLHMDGIRMA